MKKTNTILQGLLLLSVLILSGGWQVTGAQTRLTLQSKSRLWIEGTSTLNTFTCRSKNVGGYGVLERSTSGMLHTLAAPGAPVARAEVAVRVETFDCGKQRMNRDFYKVLKADAFPMIRFTLDEANVLGQPDAEDRIYRLRVLGRLTIAGVTRRIEMRVLGWPLADGRYRVTGKERLLMSDFEIDRPTALLGLIRTRDRILVRFDLVAVSVTTPTTITHSTQ